MSNDTLVYNVGKIEELGNVLKGLLNEFDEAVEAMFKLIDETMNQADHWTGEVYDSFKEKCDSFRKTRIDAMYNNLKAYVDHFFKTAGKAAETTSMNKETVMRDMENIVNKGKDILGSIGSNIIDERKDD